MNIIKRLLNVRKCVAIIKALFFVTDSKRLHLCCDWREDSSNTLPIAA
jgi:hypothetical protein